MTTTMLLLMIGLAIVIIITIFSVFIVGLIIYFIFYDRFIWLHSKGHEFRRKWKEGHEPKMGWEA